MTEEPRDPRPVPDRSRRTLAGRIWPIAIVVALALHVLLWVAFTVIATRDPSFAVEPDYYRKSLRWDETAAQLRANERLGWQLAIETEAEADLFGRRRLAVRITDAGGEPVGGAAVSMVLFHHARAGRRERVLLVEEEEEAGLYTARPRMRRGGIWECRLTARRGGNTFTHVGLHEVRSGARE